MSQDLFLNSELEDDKVKKVWCKGERCLAPWSGDGNFYNGVIKQIHRHGIDSVTASVQFDDYPDEDWEEICLTKLKIVPKEKKSKNDVSVVIHDDDSEADDSMFKPLCGKEEISWLQEKYSRFDYDSDDESVSATNSVKKKSVVATGGTVKTVNRTRKNKTKERSTQDSSDKQNVCLNADIDITTPGTSSTNVSDIKATPGPSSSNLGHEKATPGMSSTKLAHDKHSNDGNLDNDRPSRSNTDRNDSCDEKQDGIEGFDDEDMEKPKFKFTPSAAKIPYLLSEPGKSLVIQVPACINQYLRDYQREGIKFLYSHYSKGRGAILGDDMGLGKTVQVIGLIAALLKKQGNRIDVLRQKPRFIRQMSDNAKLLEDYKDVISSPFLIIGPGSLLYNWMDEFEAWGYFTVGKYHGADKTQCLADLQKGKYEIIVTTFETFRDNFDEMNSIEWAAVFVDEVHKIKGLKAQTTQALRNIDTQLRYGLTGTALQNSMEELWCILDWCQPDSLQSKFVFKEEFIIPIEKGLKNDATKHELAIARKKKESFAKMRSTMMIRRTKKLISDQLPQKDDNVVFCKMTDLQIGVYKEILSHAGMEFVMTMDDPCTCGSGLKQKHCHKETPDGSTVTSLMFTYMHLLLKTANHVALLTSDKATYDKLSPCSKEVCQKVFEKFPEFFSETKEATFKTLSNPKFCGKMKVLQGLLKIFNKDHSKVLIFSYSTKILDILEQYMMTTGYEYRRLDGSTSMKKRMVTVREFNNDPNIFIFLISTKAGGLGLNLTGANRVVIFDPNWNPTHDLQAQDRAYRIGQRRNVRVYRLISAGTIEENMYLRQVYKQQLDGVAVSSVNSKRYFRGIAGDPRHQGELFGIKNMFQLRTGESCLTMDILKRNENLESALGGYNITKYIPPVSKGDNNSDTDNNGSDLDSADDSTATESSDDKELAKLFGIIVSDEEDEAAENITGYSSPDSDTEQPNKKRSKSSIKRSRNDVTVATKTAKSPKKSDNNNNASKSRTKESKVVSKVKESKVVSKAKESRVVTKGKVSKVKDNEVECATYSSVGDLFDHCGVLHVHENRKVVGSSKAEDHMSKCALQDVYELHQNLQIPAAYCQPFSESSEESDFDVKTLTTRSGRKKKGPDHNSPRAMVIGKDKVLIGQTPRAIRQKEFKKISEHYGIGDLTELAETILKGSVNDRMEMLKDFYGSQNPEYQQIFEISETETSENPQSSTKSSRKQKKVTTKNHRSSKRSKLNQTLGIAYNDISDSESQTNYVRQDSGSVKCSDGSYDVGKTVTPKSHKKSTTNTRLRSSKSQKTCTKTYNSHHPMESSSKTKQYYMEELYHSNSNSESESDGHDPEVLLQTMVREPDSQEVPVDDVKVKKERERDVTDQDMSVLDDIFSNEGSNSNQRKRKPPPSKKQKVKNKELDDLMTDDSSVMNESTGSCTDEVDGILNESTLKDDMFDCFSDPQKWKRKKRKKDKSALSAVDRLIVEGDEEYEQLFTSGKMKKSAKHLPKSITDGALPNKKVIHSHSVKKTFTNRNQSSNKMPTSSSSNRMDCDEAAASFDASKSLFSL